MDVDEISKERVEHEKEWRSRTLSLEKVQTSWAVEDKELE